MATAKETVAAKKEALDAAKAAKQKRLTELTDAKLMLDGKMPKAGQAASRRRPSVGPKPGREAVGFCLRCPPINRKATVIALLVLLALAGGLAGLIYFATCRKVTWATFTSREDLRRAIRLYDDGFSLCDWLHGGKLPIEAWDVSAVTDMSYLLRAGSQGSDYGIRTFNHNISAWDVSAVTTMRSMLASSTNTGPRRHASLCT